MTYTRRTHIVRFTPEAKPGDPPGKDAFIDVEVLDAISFRYENGKEMVLNCPAASARTYIVDDTGGGNEQTPSNPTRRSHMKRIKGDDPKQMIDIEVIDFMAFRDQNGEEWILDMNSTNGDPSVFNQTDDSGGSKPTRRTHNEKISKDRTNKDPTDFMTIERCDAMAFRTINGKEMVIACPSNDDPNNNDPRASTYVWSPEGYDPENPDGPTPPDASADSSVYLAFVQGADGFMTGKTKISQGPFWWIRNVSGGGGFVLLEISAGVLVEGATAPPPPPKIEIDFGDPKLQPLAKVIDTDTIIHNDVQQAPATTLYFVWNDVVPFPTAQTYNVPCNSNNGLSFTYLQQWPLKDYTERPRDGSIHYGFPSFAAASAFATFYNSYGYLLLDYFKPDGGIVLDHSLAPDTVYPAAFDAPSTIKGSAATTIRSRYLLSIPSGETTIKVKVSGLGPKDNCSVYTLGASDTKTKPKKVDDISYGGRVEPDAPTTPDVISGYNLGPTTFTIKTKVISTKDPAEAKTKPHHVQIIVSGGVPFGPPR